MKTARKRRSLSRLTAAFLMVCSAIPPAPAADSTACLRGINLSGAEFGENDGIPGTDYTYPSEATVAYFSAKGMNAVRLPFRWERLQPALDAELDEGELARLREAVALIRRYGMRPILDPHNYGYFGQDRIGSTAVPVHAFADFWGRLAAVFAGDTDVIFGLMNEPYDLTAPDWLAAANAAIVAIRLAGARNLVLVPGTIWSGAHSWERALADGSNGTVMLGVKDVADNYAYEVHQYLDEDFSGTHADCPRADDAVAALERFTAWLKTHRKRGFLGEFGASEAPACVDGLAKMVDVVSTNRDVWIGWTYWVAGDWWSADEPLNVQPTGAGDRRQLRALVAANGRGAEHPCPSLADR